jgi:hypothetical protein
MRGDRKAPGQDAGVGLEPGVCAEAAEARRDSTVRWAFDHPVTTTGLWVEFECCGRNWGTVAWLALHGRIACGACGRPSGAFLDLRLKMAQRAPATRKKAYLESVCDRFDPMGDV